MTGNEAEFNPGLIALLKYVKDFSSYLSELGFAGASEIEHINVPVY